jgi:hypothetical protein
MNTGRSVPLMAWQWLLLLTTLGVLWWTAGSEMTGSSVVKDASENLQMAMNLAHHGVMSIDKAPPYRPSMMREPAPIAVLSGLVYASDRTMGEARADAYFSGDRARYLKHVNLLWLTLLAVTAFLAIRRFTSSFALAWLGSILVASHFTWFVPLDLRQTLGVNNLDTELAGAALLTTASLLLSVGFASGRPLAIATAGVCFGLTALTKAAVFYVCIGLLLVLAAYQTVQVLRGRATRPSGRLFATAAVAFLLLPLAWMSRNYLQTGFFQITERSGSVLMHRAFMDTMTSTEFVGAFTVWSEPHIGHILSRLTGFTPEDEQAGGRLQRLAESFSGPAQEREQAAEDAGRPDEALSWYRKARAIYEQKLAEFTQAASRYPSGAADLATRREAASLISQHPIKHVAVTALLVWRGAPLLLAILILAAVHSWRRGRAQTLVFALPGMGLILFYAAASQFATRFGELIVPIAIVELWFLIAAFAATGGASETARAQCAGRKM